MGARNCKRVQGWKVRLDLFRLDTRHIFIMRIINCWNNLRAEVVSLSLENIAVLCCKMCCSLIMAFVFKMGNNRDSVSMEEVKIMTLMLVYCLCSLSSLICRVCIFSFKIIGRSKNFLLSYLYVLNFLL